MLRKKKVYGYYLADGKLLVFREPDFPEVGVQVPGGTVESGESLEHAILREFGEETGYGGWNIVRMLGQVDFDARPYGRDEIHERYFFEMSRAPGEEELPGTWEHYERWGGAEPILFRFEWLPPKELELAASQGALLNELAT